MMYALLRSYDIWKMEPVQERKLCLWLKESKSRSFIRRKFKLLLKTICWLVVAYLRSKVSEMKRVTKESGLCGAPAFHMGILGRFGGILDPHLRVRDIFQLSPCRNSAGDPSNHTGCQQEVMGKSCLGTVTSVSGRALMVQGPCF